MNQRSSAAALTLVLTEDTFSRGLLYELNERFKTIRSDTDIISELEAHIRALEGGDDPIVTRGC